MGFSSSSGAPFQAELRSEGRAGSGLFASVRAHLFVVAVITLEAVLAAVLWSATRAPTYEASAQVLVTPIPEYDRSMPQLPLLRASSDRTRVIQTAASLVDSPDAAAITAERLGSDWTAARVQSAVDVLPEGESDILSVTARAGNATLAARLANEFASASLEARRRALAPVIERYTAQVEGELSAQENPSSPVAVSLAEVLVSLRALGASGTDPTLSLSRRADPPESQVGLSPLILAGLGLLAGLTVGIGTALVIEMLRAPRVADAADAVRATGLPVLARVPAQTLRDRVRRSARLPFRPSAAHALRRLQHQLEVERPSPRRLLLVGASLGDGATTSVAELAVTLARAGRDVLAVDLDTRDPQLAARLGVSEPASLSALLTAGEEWEAGITPVPGTQGVRLLSIGSEDALGIPDEVAEKLPRVLAEAQARFDYVLVDGPPIAESAEVLRIVSAVDAIVLVVKPGSTQLIDIATALDLLHRARKRPKGLLLVGGRAHGPRGDQAAGEVIAEPARAAGPLERSAEA